MEGYSRLELFDPETDDWESYRERQELVFTLNKVEESYESRKRSYSDSVCGKKAYLLLEKLTVCAGPTDQEVV